MKFILDCLKVAGKAFIGTIIAYVALLLCVGVIAFMVAFLHAFVH